MYVGFSFLSLVEVFEIFTRRIAHLMWRPHTHFRTVAKVILETVGRLNAHRRWRVCGN